MYVCIEKVFMCYSSVNDEYSPGSETLLQVSFSDRFRLCDVSDCDHMMTTEQQTSVV